MKKSMLLLLCACSSVYAESRVLPPVIDNSIYPQGGAYGSSAPSSNAMYEVLGRLEQLQAEVQQLRGVVEEQSQTIDDLKKRQGNIYSDLDLRIQELAGIKAIAKANGLDLLDSSQQAFVSPVTGVVNATQPAPQQAVSEQQQTAEQTSAIKPVVIHDKARYQAAYELLRNGHNSRAIAEFKALLAASPKGEFADNSQYWLGEAYKVNQNLDAAKEAFLKVVMDYVDSPKVADALLKLGYIEFEQKNLAKARDYLTQVTVAHPDTTAAHLASKKLMQIGALQL